METSQTPQRLRLLEKGWRERRRVALVQALGVEPLGIGAQNDFERPLRPTRGINGADSGHPSVIASGAETQSPEMVSPGATYDPGSIPRRPKRIASVSFAVPDATRRDGRIGSIGLGGRDRMAVKGTGTNSEDHQAGGPAALPTPPPSPTATPRQPVSEAPQGVTSLKTNDRPSPIPNVSSTRKSIKPVNTPPDTRRSAQASKIEGGTKQSDCPAHPSQPRSAIPPASTNTPRAIVSHPLPPSRPVAITSTSSTTIQIPTSPHLEMVLRTDDQVIRIRPGGLQVDISPRKVRVKDEGEDERGDERKGQRNKGTTCTLRLSEARKWSAQDRQRWFSLYDLVEGYKRVVPRVKLWHQLGRLTITCSTPPDIILAYTDTTQDIEQTSSTSQMDSSATSRTTSTGVVVRITYSRCRAILQIDLSTRSPAVSQSPSETFRSKRVIAIRTADTSSRHAATGPPTDRERKATQYDTSEKEAGRVLGVQTSTWSSAEREALRRLWCLRHEWERYTEGETRG